MPDSPSRSELISFLKEPDSYPHHPADIELVETHISLVAIAGKRVYKVKKPVHLQFVDYRSLNDRKSYCEAEVTLNRRLCSDVYLRVKSIGWQDGELVFGAEPAVEYAVEMKRLSEEHFLHHRIESDDITAANLDPVIRQLATFISSQDPSPETAEWGWTHRIRKSLDENLLQTSGHIGHFVTQPAYDTLAYFFDRFLDQKLQLLAERRAGGCFINGHGDLRLEHIHLDDERVCVFDCIEFSERLRFIDFANELAFLMMEFDVMNRPDLRDYFLKEIAPSLDRPLPLLLVTFYACYRAHVRAKVEGMQALDQHRDPDDRAAHGRKATRRYQQALRYAIGRSKPLIVIVMGAPATGKSSVAEALGRGLGWPVFSSDRIRKEQAGVALDERPEAAARADLYTKERSKHVYASLKSEAIDACKASQGAILDATFSKASGREEVRSAFAEAGTPYAFIELSAPEKLLRMRLKQRDNQSVVSDARLEDFSELQSRYEAPNALEDRRHIRISAEGNLQETVSLALKRLVQLQW